MESTLSRNTTDGEQRRATSNTHCTIFSLSPLHFDTRVEAVQLKNVHCWVLATAAASRDLPVPGGPKSRHPFQGSRKHWNISGSISGNTIASCRIALASARPDTVREVLEIILIETREFLVV